MSDSALKDYSEEMLRLVALSPGWTGRKIMAWAAYYQNRDRYKLRETVYDHIVGGKRNLVNLPMGFTKSTTVPATMLPMMACFYRWIRQIVVSEAEDRALKLSNKARLTLMKGGYRPTGEDIGRIHRDFGTFVPGPEEHWTQSMWSVSNRGAMDPDHPTCVAQGLFGKKLGARCDIIYADDIISLHNSQTDHQVLKTSNYMNAHILSRLDRGGNPPWPFNSVHIVGNHFGVNDYLVELKDKAGLAQIRGEELGLHLEGFRVLEMSGYADAAQTVTILPELYSRTDVEQMRIDLGETLFQLAVMNNPSGMQDLPFPETRNRYWTLLESEVDPPRIEMRPPLRHLEIHVGWDIGGSKKGNAYTAGTVAGLHRRSRNIYFLDFVYGNWETWDFYQRVADIYDEWHPKMMYMENVSAQQRIIDSIILDQPQLYGKLEGIPAGTDVGKDNRIKDALVAPHKAGKLFFPSDPGPESRWKEATIMFNHFPGIRKKDVPDSMEMSVRKFVGLIKRTPLKAGLVVGKRT